VSRCFSRDYDSSYRARLLLLFLAEIGLVEHESFYAAMEVLYR